MDDLPFSMIDIGIVGVLLISALLAFSRGFVREVLSIGAWVAAAIVTLYGFPYAQPVLRQHISVTLVADALTGAGIFIISLVVFAAISSVLARNVRGSAFGALLVCVAFLMLGWLMTDEEERPAWLAEARSLPLVVVGADFIESLLPKGAAEQGEAAAGEARRTVEQAAEAKKAVDGLSGPAPAPGMAEPANPAVPPEGSGYKDDERKDLERLIQNSE